jgi:hypothetical protein
VLSRHLLAGELAGRREQATEMNRHFTAAIQLEDKLPYIAKKTHKGITISLLFVALRIVLFWPTLQI